MEPTPFSDFCASLQGAGLLARLREGVIGEGAAVPGPFGPHRLIYADYAASGRALLQVEQFILELVLPYYANSHTEASFCGGFMTGLRRDARAQIARSCGADEGFSTIFAGSGATAGLNRLVHLFGVPEAVRAGQRPVIFMGPYEHHSNILPWRESGAEIIEIAESSDGGPDMQHLEAALISAGPDRLKIGTFSAASNVTGILTDTAAVTALLKAYDALSVWDYAGGGAYLPIQMHAGTEFEKDAVVVSPHKFLGGPGASGVLIVRNAAVARTTPVSPGGGTVRFVSPWGHDYSENLAAREEAGTPNVMGDIRAGLCFAVKDAVGIDTILTRDKALRERALSVWSRNPNIQIMGNMSAEALPIFSMRVRDGARGALVHHQLFTRLLSDHYGIQARGGCACAGPYAHRLLQVDETGSDAIRTAIFSGNEMEKPGWTRLNLGFLLTDAQADIIIDAVDELARDAAERALDYTHDPATARFRFIGRHELAAVAD